MIEEDTKQQKAMYDLLMETTSESIDVDRLREDESDLREIANEFPKDGVVDISNMERLAGLSMRGITICDYWAPILMVVIGDLNSKRNKAKNDAYINAAEPTSGRLTADLRKSISEADPEYNRLCLAHDRMRAVLRYFEDKRDSFKTFHFFMKDQQKAYGYQGGRTINGENLEYKNTIKQKPSTGEEDF